MPNRSVLLALPIARGHPLVTPDLGLGFLATVLRDKGWNVAVRDFPCERLSLQAFAAYIDSNDFAVIGFKLFSNDLHSPREMMKTIRRLKPSTTIVLGGPHPSCSPEDVLIAFPEADYAFWGEAEETLPVLLELVTQNEATPERLAPIAGLIFRIHDSVQVNQPAHPRDLDRIGIPAWDLIDPRKYENRMGLWPLKRHPRAATLHAVRGCANDCAFCTAHRITGRTVRFRSIGLVMQELKMLHDDYGVREFHIIDDAFTADHDYAMEFCAALNRSGLDLVWACPIGLRLDSLSSELLKAMEASGCYAAVVGIESGSQRILDFVRKGLTLETIREKTALIARETNWILGGFFVLGFPTETREEIYQTINFAAELPLDTALFGGYHLVKGTDTYRYVRREEKPSDTEFSPIREYGDLHVLDYAPEGMSKAELAALVRRAYWKFFLSRPSRILRLIGWSRRPWQLASLARRFGRVMLP